MPRRHGWNAGQALLVMLALSVYAAAQADQITNLTSTPIPGAGHNYVGMLNETVNPTNGSINLHIDTPTPTGRRLRLPFSFTYNNGLYAGSSTGLKVVGSGYMTIAGWSYSVPMVSYGLLKDTGDTNCVYNINFIFYDSRGGRNRLREGPNQTTGGSSPCILHPRQPRVYTSTLGSIMLDSLSNPQAVVTPDGVTYHFPAGPHAQPAALLPDSIEDTNGNQLTIINNGPSSNQGHGGPFVVNDTAGRTLISSSGLGATGNTVSIAGLTNPYRFTWTSTTVNFGTTWTRVKTDPGGCFSNIANSVSSSSTGVTALTLPNGRQYTFAYEPTYGELSQVTYPSGGWVKYIWGLNTQSEIAYTKNSQLKVIGSCAYRYDVPAVKTRQVSFDGQTVALQQDFSYSTTWNPTSPDKWTSKQTTITIHDFVTGQIYQTVYVYSAYDERDIPTFGIHLPNLITLEQSETYKDVNGSALRTVNKAWYNQYLLKSESITLDDGQTSQSAYTYGTAGLITEKDEYDYGQTVPSRKAVYTYQPFGNTPLVTVGPTIFDRPCSIIIYDAGGNRVAETDYLYDGGTAVCGSAGTLSVTGVSNLTAHDETNYGPSSTAPRGNVTQKITWLNTGSSPVMTYTYDESGQVSSIADPNGNTTLYAYTDNYVSGSGAPPATTNAYLTTVTHPTVNAVTQHEFYQYAYSDGQLTASQDDNDVAAGKSTSYQYNDSLRRLTETDYPDGGYVKLSYNDAAPSPSVSKTTLMDSTTTPNVTQTMITVSDGVGHVKQTQLTSDPEGTDFVDTSYDGAGLIRTRSNPHRASALPTDGVTTYSNDPLGRTTQVARPDGASARTSYVGNCSTVTDEAGKARKSCQDAFLRLTRVFEDPGSLNYETDYQYDTLNNLTRVDQQGSAPADSSQWRTRTFTYDSLSRLQSATNPESGTITYGYDVNGNVMTKTEPKQNQTNPASTVKISYCYDALNRMTSKASTLQACPMASPLVTYSYDQGTNGIGHRTGMDDTPGDSSWAYDVMGRLLSETRHTNTVAKVTSYAYNADGALKSLTYPSGRVLNYTYNSAGRPTQMVDPSGPINYVTSATYAPNGSVTSYKNGVTGTFAGVTVSNTYDMRLQPVLMSATSPSATVFSLCYDFHLNFVNPAPCNFTTTSPADNGDVYLVKNNRDGNRTEVFTYDSLNRIKQAYSNGPSWGEAFTIDAWGNLTNRDPVAGKTNYEALTAAPASNLNQLSGFGHDAAGNLMTNGGLTYSYDAENRLASVSGTGLTYIYDGDGQRVQKSGTPTSLYWYDMGGNALTETNGSGGLISDYVFFNGKRVARRDANASIHYYFSDHLGSASVITDASGLINEESDYYPYGGEIPIINNDPNHYKFTGKERDGESGLDNFEARYYASNLGRFMTPDWALRPIAVPYAVFGDPQTLNLYTYVENEPLNRIDADGHGDDKSANKTEKANENAQKNCAHEHDGVSCVPGQNYSLTQANQQAQNQTPAPQPAPTDPQTGKPTPPPVPVPGAPEGTGWKWNPDPQNPRGGTWGPDNWKGPNPPRGSWDPDGHWDVDKGDKSPRDHYDPKGNPITPGTAHPGNAPTTMMDKMRSITPGPILKWGTAGVVIYIIIDEGSRLYPPRNLVPVP